MTPLLLALALAVAAAPAAPKPHPFNVRDLVTLKRLSGFAVSPDGTRLAYALRSTDLEANKGRFDLWLVNADGSGNRPLTTDPASDTSPAWSPDGKWIYFLSARGGSSQVWRIAADGGEAHQVTHSPIDVDTFILSPTGAHVAFSADTFPDCADLDCTAKRLEEKKKDKATGQVYDGLFVRHWDTWKDGRRAHVFVASVGGGAPVDVMKKMVADAPSKPFGGAEEYTFAPDGKGVVFTARDVGREEAWSTDLDLFYAPIDGKKAPKKLTTTNRATDSTPLFSPDGKTLAYLAMRKPGFESDKRRLVLRSWVDGSEKSLTEGWDRSVSTFSWSPDSKTLYVTADDVGQSSLFAIDAATGEVTTKLARGWVTQAEAAGNAIVFQMDSLTAPADLYSLPVDGAAQPTQLTQVNAEQLASIKMGTPEQFSFDGANGDKVYGYVVTPPGFDKKRKYPLAFLIHGGPQGSFGNHFHYRWNPQPYAGHGYVAVMVDFHGSTGYGQAFTDSISGDWGGKPVEDLKKGYESVLKQYPFIDGKRACALGASYGGWMVNWIAGVWNEPWKCLVAHDGNLDEKMAYYDTEELWFPEWEHGGTPWDNPMGYDKHNPVNNVASWKVPMLVIHGGKDYRVVDTEGLASFTVLQRRGIPSKLLYFADENHWVLKPANSIQWHDTVLGWLDEWALGKKPRK